MAGRNAILEALEDARGDALYAAHLLGVTRRQLSRYLWRERLWEELDRIRAHEFEEAQRGRRIEGSAVRDVPGHER